MSSEHRLERSLGLELPGTLVWACPTVAALAPHLASKLGLTQAGGEPQPAGPEPVADVLDRIRQLSEDEVERRFAALVLKQA